MPNCWLVMMNEENLNYTINHGVYGLPEKSAERLRALINIGDNLLVYVIKKGCSELCESFAAVLEVASGWRESGKPTWPDEVKEGVVKYPWVVDVNVVVKGKVSYSEVYSELTRLQLEDIRRRLQKAGRRVGFGSVLRILSANVSAKPLEGEVCELIKARLQPMGRVVFTHDDVKGWLMDVGELLGYYAVTEYVSEGYRFDVVWWSSERDFKGGRHPSAVFEVQRSGSLVEALARLKHAWDKWNVNGLYLVVTEEEDADKAQMLIKPQLMGSFHELMGRVKIWTAKMVKDVRDALAKYEDKVRELSTLRD